MWDRNPDYKSKLCLVCGRHTKDLAAPLGIASGSFPICSNHDDRTIVLRYLEWCTARQVQAERSA
jgi:hypothetical protein